MSSLRDRILATRSEAERRLALAESVPSYEWEALVVVAAAVVAEQRRIIAACDADLALLADWTFPGDHYAGIIANLTARYPNEVD